MSYSIKLSVNLEPRSKFATCYFWDRFHTRYERFDLAFELKRIATAATQHGIYFQHFWHPDLWAWVETTSGGKAVFMGFHNSLPVAKCAYVLPSNTALKWKDPVLKTTKYAPNKTTRTNYLDVLIYCVLLLTLDEKLTTQVPYKADQQFKVIDWAIVEKALDEKANIPDTMIRDLRSAIFDHTCTIATVERWI